MGAPFYAEYAFRNNQVDDYADVINQFLMAARHTLRPENDVPSCLDVSRKTTLGRSCYRTIKA